MEINFKVSLFILSPLLFVHSRFFDNTAKEIRLMQLDRINNRRLKYICKNDRQSLYSLILNIIIYYQC